MRIRHFLSSLHPKFGGPTASVPVQCCGLVSQGADVTLVTYTESRPFEEKLKAKGVTIVDFERPASKIAQVLHLPLKKLLTKGDDADIYHYHGVWMPCNHWVSVYAHMHGKKTVVNPRGDLEIARIN